MLTVKRFVIYDVNPILWQVPDNKSPTNTIVGEEVITLPISTFCLLKCLKIIYTKERKNTFFHYNHNGKINCGYIMCKTVLNFNVNKVPQQLVMSEARLLHNISDTLSYPRHLLIYSEPLH